MSLNWKMDRDDKPVYTEEGHVVSLYVVAYKREKGRMGTIKKKPDEELWHHRIVRNFALPRDAHLSAQPAAGIGELSNLGIGPEKKKRATTSNVAPKKSDAEKTQSSKARNVGEKKGIRHSSDNWCDYVVVSDTLEGLAPAVTIRRPKPEPRDSADIPPSNPEDPIDLESSPEHLVQRGASKRKQSDAEAEGQPLKKVPRKKIARKGNLDAFIPVSAPQIHVSPVSTEPTPVVNEELPPSPSRASITDQLKTAEVPEGGVEKTVKPVDVTVEAENISDPGIVDGVDNPQTSEVAARESERENTVEETPASVFSPEPSDVLPERVEKVAEEQGSFSIRPEETPGDHYYRTYTEKNASEPHAPV
ncbi:hypothetical protein Hdeb2414_s0113g00799051 [Helianthus debilis subsp. tardiflorus]